MRKCLILALSLVSQMTWAQSAQEEALILNQELQYLEDSVNNIQSASVSTDDHSQKNRALNEKSLEKTYFSEEWEEDSVSTRSAGAKKRGL